MFAPTQAVTLDDGSSIELRALYASRPLGLVFLRHLGCIFCREIVSRMRAFPESNLAFIAVERAEQCAAFRARYELPHRLISDPGRALYEAFGLGRGGLGQVLNAHTIRRGLGAMRSGVFQGPPTGDPLALGGAFVVDCDGAVTWEYRSRDIADNPSASAILEALAKADAPKVQSYPFAGIAQR